MEPSLAQEGRWNKESHTNNSQWEARWWTRAAGFAQELSVRSGLHEGGSQINAGLTRKGSLGSPSGWTWTCQGSLLRMFAEHAHWKIAPLRVPGEKSVSHPESLRTSEPWEICPVQVRVPIRPSRSPKASEEELGLILRSPTRLRIYATTEPSLVWFLWNILWLMFWKTHFQKYWPWIRTCPSGQRLTRRDAVTPQVMLWTGSSGGAFTSSCVSCLGSPCWSPTASVLIPTPTPRAQHHRYGHFCLDFRAIVMCAVIHYLDKPDRP